MADWPESPACTTTVMPASFTRAQNGSNIGSAGENRPSGVVGAAGRMTIVRAPLSSANSSSSIADSSTANEMYGAVKMRPS